LESQPDASNGTSSPAKSNQGRASCLPPFIKNSQSLAARAGQPSLWAIDHRQPGRHAIRRLGKPYRSFSGAINRRVKQVVNYVNKFEDILTSEARKHGVDGVICGHIHQPTLRDLDGILYGNTGDWVENCNALVEHEDGRLELIHGLDRGVDPTLAVEPTAGERPRRNASL
jgi:UDP-2,3-diacylglucosamine pyrophosphatase LpxH